MHAVDDRVLAPNVRRYDEQRVVFSGLSQTVCAHICSYLELGDHVSYRCTASFTRAASMLRTASAPHMTCMLTSVHSTDNLSYWRHLTPVFVTLRLHCAFSDRAPSPRMFATLGRLRVLEIVDTPCKMNYALYSSLQALETLHANASRHDLALDSTKGFFNAVLALPVLTHLCCRETGYERDDATTPHHVAPLTALEVRTLYCVDWMFLRRLIHLSYANTVADAFRSHPIADVLTCIPTLESLECRGTLKAQNLPLAAALHLSSQSSRLRAICINYAAYGLSLFHDLSRGCSDLRKLTIRFHKFADVYDLIRHHKFADVYDPGDAFELYERERSLQDCVTSSSSRNNSLMSRVTQQHNVDLTQIFKLFPRLEYLVLCSNRNYDPTANPPASLPITVS
jgi:hypothetical protein